nr:hypothetical protein [Tanacetum cinerariifolium]
MGVGMGMKRVAINRPTVPYPVVLRGPHMPTPPPVAAAAAHHVTYNIFVDNCRN